MLELVPIRQVMTVATNPTRSPSSRGDRMDTENEEESSESESQPTLPTSIDQPIYVPQIDAVIIVDLQNGLFLAELKDDTTATLKPYFQLEVKQTSHAEI